MSPTLHGRLLQWADRRPDRVAIEHDGTAHTWRAFAQLVDEEAGHIGAGDVIGWLGHNSVRMLATLLACGLRGAVFVPLNWRLSAHELATIARDAGLTQLRCGAETAELAQAVRAQAPLRTAPSQAFASGDVMLVYTSGTTGEPKGAVHTQAGMLANIDAAIDAQGFDERTRALAVLPLFHVGGLCIQVLPTLAAGGTLRLHTRFDPAAWLHDAQAWRPSTSLLVPATMRALIEHPAWGATDLSALRFVNSGSSIVPSAFIEAFHARGVPVAQVYGATETGPVSLVLRPDEAREHVGSVGRPALGVEVRLVNGELQLRGANLMRGYHHEPPRAPQAWFATGDLAERDAHGFHRIVGRSKELIISGGENIHPAEIENLLAADAEIAEAAVVGLPDARWGEVPVLAVVARPGAPVDVGRVRAVLEARLARFKLPRHVIVLDALPKTALGKVQKAALAAQLLPRVKHGPA